MNILLLGSGGREHALAWKLAQSPLLDSLFIAPGNAGTSRIGRNLEVKVNDFQGIRQAVIGHRIDMVVVGPEDPLVLGIHDFFLADPELKGIPVIGPCKMAAMLEGSKDFAKQFMIRHAIPTARYQTFDKTTIEAAIDFLQTLPPPFVLKADGLAAGKGVIICPTMEEAVSQLKYLLLDSPFGEASRKVVIEEFLHGTELSVFILTDGKSYLLLPEAKDYKRIGEADTGPNTGGMGAISPVPFADQEFMARVEKRIILPTMHGMAEENIDYQGFVFFGLINVNGDPYVIEYNCRLGDPESESVIPRIKTDLVTLFKAVAGRSLHRETIEADDRVAATVMLVSAGYPGAYEKNKPISGEERIHDSLVFHAGTMTDPITGAVVTNGGRVMAVTSFGTSMDEALALCYLSASEITYDGKQYRRDLGFDLKHHS